MGSITTVGSSTNDRRSGFTRSPWKPEEDDLLIHLVKRHGPCKWDQIAKHIPPRTGASCRVRWVNQLKPGVNRSRFSGEENQKLLRLHKKYGSMWSIISDFFHGRTDNQMKNQYNFLMQNKSHETFKPPPNAYSPGTLHIEATTLSRTFTVSVSRVSGLSGLGNKFSSCPHCYRIETPSSEVGSTLWRPDEDLLAAHFSNSFCEFHQSSFLMHEGSAYLEIYPQTQRQQELVVEEEKKLIDFMGVGKNEDTS